MPTAPPASTLPIPSGALVVLVGAAGCGKSTFARSHFRASEIVSSDAFREMVADDPADQSATAEAFELLHLVARKRLGRGRLTVVDATNTYPAAREALIAIARESGAHPVAVVLDVEEETCQERNRARTDRQVPPHAIQRQVERVRAAIPGLEAEGFARVHVLRSGQIAAVREIVRTSPAAPSSAKSS